MAQLDWLLVEYRTITGATRFTVLPEFALVNRLGIVRPDRLLETISKYAAVLSDLMPATIIAYQRVTENETHAMCDAVTLCYLIAVHDLTFSFSDDYRYYSSGQASLNRIHRIVRDDNSLAWFLWKLWNVKVSHGVTPEHQPQWQLTPAQVAAIAGDPSIKTALVNQEMATP